MTSLLKEAFNQAAQLPEWEQDALAALILEEIAAGRNWETAEPPARNTHDHPTIKRVRKTLLPVPDIVELFARR